MKKAKSVKKKAAKKAPAAAKKKAKRSARKAAPPKKAAAVRRESSWLDEAGDEPRIAEKARQLESFLAAMADGVIDQAELEAQERRLVKVMKEVEPLLDDHQHAKVTELLCELPAYDLMQVMHSFHQSRPKTEFQG